MATREPRGVREYSTNEIVVEWKPSICYHSHNCVRALPKVFDPERRPWVDPKAASADEIEAAVAGCPSGALRTRRPGAPEPERERPLEVRASAQGPLLLRGGVRVLDGRQRPLRGREGRALPLRRSQNKPFCDGTHRTIGFEG